MLRNFIRVGDDLIINTHQVTHIRKVFGGDVLIGLVGDGDSYFRFSAEKAESVWEYFSKLDDSKDE